MDRQHRYQFGTLEKKTLRNGAVWYLRYHRTLSDGRRKRERIRVGTLAQYPSESAARRASSHLLAAINSPAVQEFTMHDVIERYIREEMPSRYSTRKRYLQMLRVHIDPAWGAQSIRTVKAEAVRRWLLSLELATRTRGHLHGMMKLLFKFAMLWEWIPLEVNPMSLFQVPGATKRTKKKQVLTPEQIHAVVEAVPDYMRLIVTAAACWGLRCSELFALQWQDFDWLASRVSISRAVVDGHVGPVKTEYSEKKLPMHPALAELFQRHFSATEFREPDSWVFANPNTAGEFPYRPTNLQHRGLRTASKRAGIPFPVGWHTFRHSYRTLLRAYGAPLEVQRDLMRHADIRMTAEYGVTEEAPGVREANSAVVERIIKQ